MVDQRKVNEREIKRLNKDRIAGLNNIEAEMRRTGVAPTLSMVTNARLDALIDHLCGPFETDDETNDVIRGSVGRLEYELLVVEKMKTLYEQFVEAPSPSGLVIPR